MEIGEIKKSNGYLYQISKIGQYYTVLRYNPKERLSITIKGYTKLPKAKKLMSKIRGKQSFQELQRIGEEIRWGRYKWQKQKDVK